MSSSSRGWRVAAGVPSSAYLGPPGFIGQLHQGSTAMSVPRGRPRVVIIGGGLAGLSAADSLLRPHVARLRTDGTRTPTDAGAVDVDGGPEVVVLEASGRVGGRTATTRLRCAPAVVDIGGQWIGANQPATLELARETGVTLTRQFTQGRRVMQMGLTITSYAGLIPNISWGAVLDAQMAIWKLQLLQLFLWCLPRTGWMHRWADDTTMLAWMNGACWTATGKALIRIVVQAFTGLEPEAVSVLAFCRYVAQNDRIEAMTEIGEGSLQAWTCVGGAQQLSMALAEEVVKAGGAIRFHHVVTAVTRGPSDGSDGRDIHIQCANGQVVHADVVICALPPPLARTLHFTPPLSPARTRFMEGCAMGGIIKSIAVYRTAWWRDHGFSGEVICDVDSHPTGGPVFNAFDASAPLLPPAVADAWKVEGMADATARTPGAPSSTFLVAGVPEYGGPPTSTTYGSSTTGGEVTERTIVGPMPLFNGTTVPALVAFINGRAAQVWSSRSPEERRLAVLNQFKAWFNDDDAALSPIEYVEQDWTQYPFTRGCPIASYGRGVFQLLGLDAALSMPDWLAAGREGTTLASHRLFFVGTETASQGTGFMDGAIRSGWGVAPHVWQACQQVRRGAAPPNNPAAAVVTTALPAEHTFASPLLPAAMDV